MAYHPSATHSLAGSPSRPRAVVLVALLCLVPLFVTPVLPLMDFYPHVLRYYVLSHLHAEPGLAQNYLPAWRPLPNLGLDLLGTGLMALVPPLAGAKILAALVILAPFFGVLALARSLGPITPVTIALAGLVAFNFVLSWGFANFLLGLGIALAALGWWIAQTAHPWRQFAVTAVLALAIMLVHGLVFALWGLLLFTVEVMLIRQAHVSGPAPRPAPGPGPAVRKRVLWRPVLWRQVLWRIARLALLAVLPAILFLQTKTVDAQGGVTAAFSNLAAHAERGALWQRLLEELWKRIDSFLRVAESTWPVADRLFGVALWGVLAWGFLTGALRLDRRLWLAVTLTVLFLGAMPPNLFGVGHLDERVPLVLLALLAAGTTAAAGADRGGGRRLVQLLSALFLVHLAMVAAGWAREGQSYRRYLAALPMLEPGGLGESAFFGDTPQRDAGRSCRPLLSLLTLQNGTAVPTFANPTQQPLAQHGALAASLQASLKTSLEAGLAAAGSGQEGGGAAQAARIGALFAAGFGTVVTCGGGLPAVQVPGARLIASDGKWALYQAVVP